MNALHEKLIFKRRVQMLAKRIADKIPAESKVLDIGCGSGDIARTIMHQRPDISIEGMDILVRPKTAIPVNKFDGYSIPKPEDAYDFAMLVDVLHHTDDPDRLMHEAARIARKGLLIKDHYCNNYAAKATLSLMDWIGNSSHGVRLPYNYFSEDQWHQAWARLGLRTAILSQDLGLYPWPFSLVFERDLHFLARLEKRPHQRREAGASPAPV